MVNSKKVPEIRFSGFSDPWEQRKVGDYVDITTGKLDANAMKEDGKYDFYTSGIQKYKIDVSAFEGPAITIAGNGATVGYMHLADGKFNAYQRTYVLTDFQADRHFLFFEIGNKLPKKITQEARTGNIPYIVMDMLTNLQIVIPEKSEQEKIGQYIQQLDNLITLHQRKLEKLKTFKKAMLDKMFPKNGELVPEIRFSGFTDPWEQRKLGDVGATYTGLSGKTKEDFGHGNGKFVTYMNVFSNTVGLPDMVEPVEIDDTQNKVLYGDVLFTTSSETPEEVGMSSVWLENAENTYLNSFCFGYRPTVEFNPYYLAYMLRSFSMREKIKFLAQGISRYNISKNKMMYIEMPIPNIEEQEQIGTYFRTINNLITLHQRKLEKLQNIKKSMLNKMFI